MQIKVVNDKIQLTFDDGIEPSEARWVPQGDGIYVLKLSVEEAMRLIDSKNKDLPLAIVQAKEFIRADVQRKLDAAENEVRRLRSLLV
ncbi:MAG: hypothetical protein KGL39_00610 [Patescibacteria group bacterium]|nr:hypothetical protein [Patescibacteria group bacterium]